MVKALARLFLAFRLADAVNLAAALWFVPRFADAAAIGSVLPLASFASFATIPLFALAMTALRESARLRARRANAERAAMMRGVFAATAILLAAGLVLATFLVPRYAARIGVTDLGVGFLAVAASAAGCVSPVFTDQLQAARCFRAVGLIEIAGAVARLLAMVVLMPLRALAGYWIGALVRPLAQVAASLFALRRDFGEATARYWSLPNTRRFLLLFAATLVYLGASMGTGWIEQDLVRTALSARDSAGWYRASRLTDLLNYLSLPILIVLFPHITAAREADAPIRPMVGKAVGALLVGAVALAAVLLPFGEAIIAIMPGGRDYTGYAPLLPRLLAGTTLSAVAFVLSNARVAAGRHRFLLWYAPLHAAYAAYLAAYTPPSPERLAAVFAIFALVRLGLLALDEIGDARRGVQ